VDDECRRVAGGSELTSAALRVVPFEDPSLAIEVQTWSAMASLTYWEPYFYFGDFEHPSLSRLRAWLE
jgi:hypothetical protein